MGYFLLRLFILITIFACMIFIFKKNHLKKKMRVLFVVIFLAVLILAFSFPFENMIVSFDSMESAFDYAYSGDILHMESSQQSGAILYQPKANTVSVAFFDKQDDQYKLHKFSLNEEKAVIYKDTIIVTLYQINRSDDYYIGISGIIANELTIEDNMNSTYEPRYRQISDGRLAVNCIEAVPYSADFQLFLNGEMIDFTESPAE